MSSERVALIVAAVVFAGGLIGLVLQRMLPEKHTTGPSRDMIGAVVGLLTLLCAWSAASSSAAYGVYAGQNIAIQTLASKVLQLDLALADYGPEANAERGTARPSGQDDRGGLGNVRKATPISPRTISPPRFTICATRKRRSGPPAFNRPAEADARHREIGQSKR